MGRQSFIFFTSPIVSCSSSIMILNAYFSIDRTFRDKRSDSIKLGERSTNLYASIFLATVAIILSTMVEGLQLAHPTYRHGLSDPDSARG